MAKNWEERVSQIITKGSVSADRVASALSTAKEKSRNLFRNSAYWSAVLVFGFGLAAGIMHLSGVPVFQGADAGFFTAVAIVFGNIIYYIIIAPIGIFTILVAWLFQVVITYPYGAFWNTGTAGSGQGFVNVSAVVVGWRLVRDISNIFFALILVIIALATTLRIKAYEWKAMLPKFFIHAILINFSKSIAGVFTDLATVVMATFTGSFAKVLSVGIVAGFGLPSLGDLALSTDNTSEINDLSQSGVTSLFFAYIAAALMTMVMFVVLVVFTLTLIFRIVMLWFLIVLSPLAYITRILPQTQKYSSQWWEMFGRYVVVGPLVAFFMWLTLSMAFGADDTGNVDADTVTGDPVSVRIEQSGEASDGLVQSQVGQAPPDSGDYQATSPSAIATFAIGIMMLLASLKLITQMATELGSQIATAQEKAYGMGKSLMRYPGRQLRRFGATAGREGEDASFGQRARRIAGGAATVLGSTVFQPGKYISGLAEGIAQSSQEKEEIADELARRRLEVMRKGNRVAGQDKGAGATALGYLGRFAGSVGAGGLDPKQFVEQYASGGGLLRMGYALGSDIFGGKERAAAKKEREDAEKEKEDVFNRYTEAEAGEAINAVDDYQEVISRLQGMKSAIGDADLSSTDLNTGIGSVGNFVADNILPRIMERAGELRAGGDAGRADALTAIHDQLEDDYAQNRTVNAGGVADALKAQGLDMDDAFQAAAMAGTDLDLNAPEVRSVASNILNDLRSEFERLKGMGSERANDVKQQIDELESAMNPAGGAAAGSMSAGQLLYGYLGSPGSDEERARRLANAKESMNGALDSSIETNGKDLRSMILNLTQTGYAVNANSDGTFSVSGSGGSFATEAARTAAQQRLNAAYAAESLLIGERAALQAGISYEGRKKTNALVGEELQKIQDIKNTDELMVYLNRARREKNPFLLEAVLRRITQNGDENEIFQGMMAQLAQKNKLSPEEVQKVATSGAEGMEYFRKELLMKEFGMSAAESVTIMNDVSFIAEDIGHLGVGRKYALQGGEWHIVDEDTRNDIIANEKLKMSPSGYTNWNRLAWGDEVGPGRDFVISPAAIKMLQAAGPDMDASRIWDRMNPNAKRHLAQPKSVQALRQAGVDANFLGKLESYHRNIGQYYGSGTSPRKGASRLARRAT